VRAWLVALATTAVRRPRWAAAIVAVAAALGVALTLLGPLEVSTSRRSLISEDDPGQARLLAFLDRFGRSDAAVFVVSGGDEAERRAVVRRLVLGLEALPELHHRVLARLDLRLLAEVLALNHPRLLDGLDGVVGAESAGIAGIAKALEARILAHLDGEGGADEGEDEQEMMRLVPLARAFAAALRGEEDSAALISLAEGDGLSSHANLDHHGFLTTSDGEHHLVVTFPDLASDEGVDVAPIIDAMRGIRDVALAEVGAGDVRAELTGLPALAADELRIVGRGIRITALLSTFGILLVLLLAFRSMRWTVVGLLPLGAGVLITLGIVELIYGGLNLLTSSFVPVLMGLGIDIGVHLLYRYGEARRDGEPHLAALRTSLVRSGPGVATGVATTSMAFLTLATTSFTAFAELGVITAVGLLVMLAAAFLLFPPLMSIGAARPRARAEVARLPGVGAAVKVFGRRPWWVLGGAAALTIAAIISFLPHGPGFSGRYFDFLPDDTESYRGLIAVEQDSMMGPAIVHLTAPGFDEARALSERLRALPEVGAVHSATDLLPPLTAERLSALRAGTRGLSAADVDALAAPAPPTTAADLAVAVRDLGDAFDEVAFALEQGGRDATPAREATLALSELRHTLEELDADGQGRLARVEGEVFDVIGRVTRTAVAVAERGRYAPEDLPPFFRVRFVSRDGALLALHVNPSGDIWDNDFAGRFAAAILELQPEASGLGLDILRHQELIIDGFVRATGYAAVLILLLLFLVFRRVGDVLLAMVPAALGWVWMVGGMKPAGLQLDIANLVALPLLLGIGIAGGVHMVHRTRQSRRDSGGPARLVELVSGTGAAVLVSFVTTMVGFGALTAGGYGAMESFGGILVLGVGFCLLATVVVLPALLVVLGRAR